MANKKNKWNSLYKEYIDNEFDNFEDYFNIKMKLKQPFLKQVIKYSNNKPILECGCGTGKATVYLATKGIKSYGMDLENEMLKQTMSLSKKMCPKNPVKTILGNIKSIPFKDKFFSVTHSSGVLEHYSDSEIVEFINEQLRVSDVCIFSVPTKYFEKKMYGNERFMSRGEWISIINKSNAKIIKKFGYHYKTFGNRFKDMLKKPKNIFKPIALYGFVLIDK